MSANDRQEGGDHYKQQGKPQHWDLVRLYGWDYFQGQITKYLMRWKDKQPTRAERLVDLKKARHFLDKYIEDAGEYDQKQDEPKEALTPTGFAALQEQFLVEGHNAEGTLYTCRWCNEQAWATDLLAMGLMHGTLCKPVHPVPATLADFPTIIDSGEPGAGYVKQD